MHYHMDILTAQAEHIDLAIEVLDKAIKRGWDVKLHKHDLENVLKDVDGNHEKAIDEVVENGLESLFSVGLVRPRPWFKVLTVATFGITQIVIGYCMATSGSIYAGTKFIERGVDDLIYAVRGAITKEFSWKEWCISKGISCSMSFLTDGFHSLYNKKLHPNLVSTSDVLSSGKLYNPAQSKQVARIVANHSTKTAVVSKLTTTMVQYAAVKPLCAIAEKWIDDAVDSALSRTLDGSSVITAGLALDKKNRNNVWQSKFIERGLSFLKSSERVGFEVLLSTVGKNISAHAIDDFNANKTGTARKLSGQGWVEVLGLSNMSLDLMTATTSFCDRFKTSVLDFQKSIEAEAHRYHAYASNSDALAAYNCVPAADAHASTVMGDPLSQADLNAPLHPLSPDYRTVQDSALAQAKEHLLYMPSNKAHIKAAFKAFLVSQLMQSIDQHLISPVAQHAEAAAQPNAEKIMAYKEQLELWNEIYSKHVLDYHQRLKASYAEMQDKKWNFVKNVGGHGAVMFCLGPLSYL